MKRRGSEAVFGRCPPPWRAGHAQNVVRVRRNQTGSAIDSRDGREREAHLLAVLVILVLDLALVEAAEGAGEEDERTRTRIRDHHAHPPSRCSGAAGAGGRRSGPYRIGEHEQSVHAR
jgi:hypothetical protein